MAHNLTLSQATAGCLLYKTATGKAPATIVDYQNAYKKLAAYFPDDPPISSITRQQLVEFFAYLQDGYVTDPDGFAPRGLIHLAPKSVYNIHTALSALWTWATDEGYVKSNLIRTIEAPEYESRAIEPFTHDELTALLHACDVGRSWKTRPHTVSKRATADRDRAIVLVLLDTGIRRSELCGLTFDDVNLTANTLIVRGKGKGRGKKERTVYFGKRTARALWRYLTPRLQSTKPDQPVFTVGPADDTRPLAPNVLRRLLKRIGDRAGIPRVHPHRFRHTFAITYLRNGGDPFTLQILLGHSNLEMVRHYLAIVQADCADAHQRASPVDNWRL